MSECGGTVYGLSRDRVATLPLTDRDRRVVRAIAAGCPAQARQLARHLGNSSWGGMHKSLLRLEAHGVVLIEHGKRGCTRLASDIVVVAGDVCRMIPLPAQEAP